MSERKTKAKSGRVSRTLNRLVRFFIYRVWTRIFWAPVRFYPPNGKIKTKHSDGRICKRFYFSGWTTPKNNKITHWKI